jgi:hypothetical protein
MQRLVVQQSIFIIIYLLASAFSAAAAMPPYDRSTFIRFTATVANAHTVRNPHVGKRGLHLIVKDRQNSYYMIHVCPQWYANKYPDRFIFNQGDQLIISGARFQTMLTPNNIYAATILNSSRNGQELKLRDPVTGKGLWNNMPENLLEIITNAQKRMFSQQFNAMMQKNMQGNFMP